MSLTDDVLVALTKAISFPATVRDLLPYCPDAENTTDIARACYDLVKQGKLIRQGTAGKFTYRLADAPAPENRGLAYFPRPKVTKPPKPGVGKNPGSMGALVTPSPVDPAVAATAATPMPTPERRGSGPAPVEASAGNERIHHSIDDDGAVTITLPARPNTHVIRFTPEQSLALGDFLRLSEALWRL